MKVSDLSGALLDYWVAKVEGITARVNVVNETNIPWCIATHANWHGDKFFRPSSDWSDGGPIIERLDEVIFIRSDGLIYCTLGRMKGQLGTSTKSGETKLIAAMRAYVGLVYGREVPDETVTEKG